MEKVYLLLGGNLGDRQNNLLSAIKLLAAITEGPYSQSSIYETAAWGVENQPHFLNQVFCAYTRLSPFELLGAIHRVESKLGRKRLDKWHARTIDIDILFYGSQTISEPLLTIPHSQIQYRRFTLVPMAEIATDLRHPVLGKSIDRLLADCPDRLSVNLWEHRAKTKIEPFLRLSR